MVDFTFTEHTLAAGQLYTNAFHEQCKYHLDLLSGHDLKIIDCGSTW